LPLLHKYEFATLEVRITESPIQNVVAPDEVIVGMGGFGLTTIVVDNDFAEQPFMSVSTTE